MIIISVRLIPTSDLVLILVQKRSIMPYPPLSVGLTSLELDLCNKTKPKLIEINNKELLNETRSHKAKLTHSVILFVSLSRDIQIGG